MVIMVWLLGVEIWVVWMSIWWFWPVDVWVWVCIDHLGGAIPSLGREWQSLIIGLEFFNDLLLKGCKFMQELIIMPVNVGHGAVEVLLEQLHGL